MFYHVISGSSIYDLIYRLNEELRRLSSPAYSAAYRDYVRTGPYVSGVGNWRNNMPHGFKGSFDKLVTLWAQGGIDMARRIAANQGHASDVYYFVFDVTQPTFKEVVNSARLEQNRSVETGEIAIHSYISPAYMDWAEVRAMLEPVLTSVDWDATEADPRGRINMTPDWDSIPNGFLHPRVFPDGLHARVPLLSSTLLAEDRRPDSSDWIVLDGSERGWHAIRERDLGRTITGTGRNTFTFSGYNMTEYLEDYGVDPIRIARQIREWRQERLNRFRQGLGLPQLQTATPAQARQQSLQDAASRYDMHRAKKQHTTEIHISKMPVLPEGTTSSRRWGIEVETGAARLVERVPDNWRNISDGSLYSAYEEEYIDPEDCEYAEEHREYITVTVVGSNRTLEIDNPDYSDPDYCDSCGDVESDGDSSDCREFVSPILTSVHSDGLRQLTGYLEPGPVTQSAGLHVHVEANGLSASQIRELVMGYDAIEWLIEASYQRKERGYCKRRSARELLLFARSVKENPGQQVQAINKGDRYVTVNLQALDEHGTIEFRAMGPVYNYDHLTKWATFCREMVNAAGKGARASEFAKVRKWDDLMQIFMKYGVEVAAATQSSASVEAPAELVAA